MFKLLLSFLAVALMSVSLFAQDDAKSIIEKSIKAAGWDKADGDFSSWAEKGKLIASGQTIQYDANWKLDSLTGKHRFDMKAEIDGQKLDMHFIFDGTTAFEGLAGMTQEVVGQKLDYTKDSGHLFRVSSLKPILQDKNFKMTMANPQLVDKKATVAVKVEYPKMRDVFLYFDKETMLLVKTESKTKNEFNNWKDCLDEAYYSDWKEIGNGVRNFMKMRVDRDKKEMISSEMSDFKMIKKPDWAETAFKK